LLSQEERDAIYKKWESLYKDIELAHYFKFLRDDYVKRIREELEKGKNVVVYGSFRSGKTSLAIYLCKRLELSEKKVGYLDMFALDKSDGEWIVEFDLKKIKEESQKEIVVLDELYYSLNESWKQIIKPLFEKNKQFVAFVHSNLPYESDFKLNIIKNHLERKSSVIYLLSYSEQQEDMILNEVNANEKQRNWFKENLRGHRQLYNELMYLFFNKKLTLDEIIENFSSGIFNNPPYFIQDVLLNAKLLKKACKDRLSKEEIKRLFDFGYLSLRENSSSIEVYIPTPVVRLFSEKDNAMLLGEYEENPLYANSLMLANEKILYTLNTLH